MGRKVDVDTLVGADDVAELIGLSNPRGVSVYRTRYEDFPDPVVLKGNCVLWIRSDIEAWLKRRR